MSFLVFNKTDGIYASPNEFTKEEAEQFIKNFPKRFEFQGYYLTSNQERINPNLVELEIQEV
jgi:hypothetical protein